MKIYIDTETGTWGDAKRLRIVNVERVSFNVGSVLEQLGNMSDSEIQEFGMEYGNELWL